MSRFVRTPTALLALAALAGCSASSRDAAPMNDQIQVGQFIASLDDVKKDPKLLAPWFAAGAAPPAAELRKFAKYTCQADGRPTVTGDTATAKVKVLDANEHEVGQVEWTLVKEGGNWKLKSAPLP